MTTHRPLSGAELRHTETQLRRLKSEYEDCVKMGKLEEAQNVLAHRDRLLIAHRLAEATSYAQAVGDPAERVHVQEMIAHWQKTGDVYPVSLRFQTLPMRQVARILRGGARHLGGGALETIE